MHHLAILRLRTVYLMQQENKLDYYRGKNCMKKFCLELMEHATKMLDFENKENDTINKRRKGLT